LYQMKRRMERHPKKPERIVFNFYCYMGEACFHTDPIIIEAESLELAMELFQKDFADQSIYKITYQDKVIKGFGTGSFIDDINIDL
jgi:hypothetical protein